MTDATRAQHQHREPGGHPHAPARPLVLLPGADRPAGLRRAAARGSGAGAWRALRRAGSGHGRRHLRVVTAGRHLRGARGPSHGRPIRSPPRPATRRRAHRCPPFAVTWRPNNAPSRGARLLGAEPLAPPRTP
ncbi:hypothetical protein F5983_33470 [Streptomyces arboris]|uniref:Uncharacterized protein n=1 Tax=Streptomyces arboris TaxID=2600619 RepID=A0A5N5EQC0_9ACTN|nr:hypothetical protein F5983_33470 [Streptomyces arboris]